MVIHDTAAAAGAPEGRLRRKREVRLEAILDAATALIAAEGLEAATLARVAAATGYVPAALYRYVGSKDGLLAGLQRRAIADAHRAFEAAVAEAEALPARSAADRALAALLAAARSYLELPRTRPEAWLLIALLLGDPRPLLSDAESLKTAPLLGAFLADVRALFERAASAGALDPGDAGERTLAFWSALHGASALAKMRRIAPQLPAATEVGEATARALLGAWGAGPITDAPTSASKSTRSRARNVAARRRG